MTGPVVRADDDAALPQTAEGERWLSGEARVLPEPAMAVLADVIAVLTSCDEETPRDYAALVRDQLGVYYGTLPRAA